ncbi:MAG: nucleotidyltransferase family protein [Bryobacteraceae bacterium]
MARKHGARNIRVFGSVARGETTEDSDLDLLVEWEPGRGLLDHVGLVQDLEELLGVKVHVGTEAALHWYVRDRILREATPLLRKRAQQTRRPRWRRRPFLGRFGPRPAARALP